MLRGEAEGRGSGGIGGEGAEGGKRGADSEEAAKLRGDDAGEEPGRRIRDKRSGAGGEAGSIHVRVDFGEPRHRADGTMQWPVNKMYLKRGAAFATIRPIPHTPAHPTDSGRATDVAGRLMSETK